MDWLTAIPAILAAMALVFIPGLAVTLVLRLRLFDALALAPLISVTVLSVAPIVGSMIGVPWSPLTLLVATLVPVALAVVAQRFWLGQRQPDHNAESRVAANRREVAYFAAAAIAVLLIGSQVVRVFGAPESFSQTFDNVFHLNAVNYILETADASSLTVASMTSGGEDPEFYPAAWHGFTALVIQLSGASLTVGVNATNIVIAAMMWPLSCLFAVRQLAKLLPVSAVGAGILVGSFAAFPLYLLEFGVLYPNLLSFSMVPAGLLLLAAVLKQAPHATFDHRRSILLAVVALPGIAVAHPNGIMTLLGLAVPLVVGAYVINLGWLRARGSRWVTYVLSTVVFAALLGIFFLLWNVVRPPADAAFWTQIGTAAQAFGEAFLNAPSGRQAAWFVTALAVAGVVACLKQRRLFWLPASFLLALLPYIAAAGFESGPLRSFITGVWYNDPYRVSAIIPLITVPLAILGLDLILRRLKDPAAAAVDSLAGKGTTGSRLLTAGLGLLVVVALLPLTQGSTMKAAVERASLLYAVTDDSALVSTDELELFDDLEEIVPEDSVIAVNPWTGAGLAYALGDRETTHRHIFATTSPEQALIDQSLKDSETMPAVCEAVEETRVGYVLDFGDREVHSGDHPYPGIEEVDGSPLFSLVLERGEARLYEFLGC